MPKAIAALVEFVSGSAVLLPQPWRLTDLNATTTVIDHLLFPSLSKFSGCA
jgi:hypothetical protein